MFNVFSHIHNGDIYGEPQGDYCYKWYILDDDKIYWYFRNESGYKSMVVCLINHYYKILGDKLEKKHKIILAIVAILVIVGVCLYLNYQDTSYKLKHQINLDYLQKLQ